MGKAIMLQGTSSSVGKSVLATALCRILHQDGWRVAPFKAQNMSNNSYVTPDGREIGRAQGAQAEAAGIPAEAVMNPILLKPSADCVAQIVLLGRPVGHLGAREYRDEYVPTVWPTVVGALEELLRRFDVVVIEGAGSPAEINLKERDIANMKTAQAADAPVLLVGDIDRGGLFASYVGTLELLEPTERERVAGFIVNKFRGDRGLLQPGLDFLKQRTGRPVLGVIPHFSERLVEEEDSVALSERAAAAPPSADTVTVAVLALPHIANFTDFEPLEKEAGVRVQYVRAPEPLGQPDAVILPGSKSTVVDLAYLRAAGYERAIKALAARGVPVVGICGGYQMLGRRILDPAGVESPQREVNGLGLLNAVTEFRDEKRVVRVRATVTAETGFLAPLRGEEVEGYEIHMGVTRTGAGAPAWLELTTERGAAQAVGVMAPGGQVLGTYLHDIFQNQNFRRAFVNHLRRRKGLADLGAPALDLRQEREARYDRLAALVRQHLDLNYLYQLLGLVRPQS